MIIFNDVGLTIKGYYQELIDPIQRKKILDRLYSLIHRELFEGVQPLEVETTTSPKEQVNLPLSDITSFPPEPKVKRAYKHKAKYLRKKNKREPVIIEQDEPEPISTPPPQVPGETKDPVYDNEKDDNQYDEMKRKGLI